MAGARIPRRGQRMERPGLAAAFRQDHVRVIPAGRVRPGGQRLPPARAENSAVQQKAGELCAWRAAVLRDGDADARQRHTAGGQVQRRPADQDRRQLAAPGQQRGDRPLRPGVDPEPVRSGSRDALHKPGRGDEPRRRVRGSGADFEAGAGEWRPGTGLFARAEEFAVAPATAGVAPRQVS